MTSLRLSHKDITNLVTIVLYVFCQYSRGLNEMRPFCVFPQTHDIHVCTCGSADQITCKIRHFQVHIKVIYLPSCFLNECKCFFFQEARSLFSLYTNTVFVQRRNANDLIGHLRTPSLSQVLEKLQDHRLTTRKVNQHTHPPSENPSTSYKILLRLFEIKFLHHHHLLLQERYYTTQHSFLKSYFKNFPPCGTQLLVLIRGHISY